MPLQLFTDAALGDGKLIVRGVMHPDGTFLPEDAATLYAILQGETMVRGSLDATPNTWTDTRDAGDLRVGPALAAGVTVIFRGEPSVAFETFTWSQQIELHAA